MSEPTLSVVILTRNEEENITDCIHSVWGFADELIVFDSGSQDRTVQLAGQLGATVYQHAFVNYPRQRNAALEATRGVWVFFIDADERANVRIGEEICAAIRNHDRIALYWIPRKNYIFGKWIQHTGWWPDYQPRLLRKGAAHFDPERDVHELVIADGTEGFLNEPLTHFNYRSLAQFRAKQKVYTRMEAQLLFRNGARPKWRAYLGQPLREFVRRFISLRGYKDGVHGFALSILMAYYAFIRQRMLAEMWTRARRDSLRYD